jgi:hypothetical protein
MENRKHPRATAPRDINVQISRFAAMDQGPLSRQCREMPVFGDLLWSFPAAALALATGFGKTNNRHRAHALVLSGAPLARVARQLKLPMWLRRAPPELLHFGLPDTLSICFIDTVFGRSVAGLLPRTCPPASRWLQLVQDGRFAAGDEYALWLAGRRESACADIPIEPARAIAAFAWHSQRPWLLASTFIEKPWSKRSSFRAALSGAIEWLQRLCLECRKDEELNFALPSRVNGFEFVPLRSAGALREEGAIMQNCLAGYAERVLLGWSLIFSIRRNGMRVACLELTPDADGLPEVNEMAGPRNGRVGPEVRSAIATWLGAVHLFNNCSIKPQNSLTIQADVWRSLWAPYYAGVGKLAPYGPHANVTSISNALQRLQEGAVTTLGARN